MIPLNLLQPGERGTIFEVGGCESTAHRLSEMGLRIGASIQMVRPGNPCILAVDDNRLSLRLDPAMQIFVEIPS